MKTFPVQLLFQVAIKSYLIYCAADNNSLTKLGQLNSSEECVHTFKKKSKNKQSAFEENELKKLKKKKTIYYIR